MAKLSQDLENIRKGQKKSIKDVFESSRIPVHIIEQIENGNIFSSYANNPVYLRSFIRTYAKSLKIVESDIVRAIDEHLGGNYSGFLAKRYSQENLEKKTEEEKLPLITDTSKNPQEPLQSPSESVESEQADSQSQQVNDADKPDVKNQPRKKFFTPESLEIAREKTLKDIEEEDEEITSKAQTSTVLAEAKQGQVIDKVEWATMIKKGTTLGNNSRKMMLMVSVVLLVILGVVLFIFNRSSDIEEITQVTEIPAQQELAPQPPVVAADTAEAAPTTPLEQITQEPAEARAPVVATPPPVSTPATDIPIAQRDSLEILVYAYTDKLEPFFVGLSNGTANMPYWIEQGTAMRIVFTEEINIRGQFSRMRIIFNGNPVPNFMDFFGDNRTVSIPRAFFDEDERWNRPTPQEQWGFEPPQQIINRP